MSAGLRISLENAAAASKPDLLLTGLAGNTRQGPGYHGDGILETPALVRTRFHHKTNRADVGNHRANLVVRAEDKGSSKPRTSRCMGRDNHDLGT